ncbi:MAG: hypothetical protein LBP40_04675 [Campylobacteraceae bacterium]|jgi:hypothetical protein|nr:hypothetical protein [Campylobacteraceae bacterium]
MKAKRIKKPSLLSKMTKHIVCAGFMMFVSLFVYALLTLFFAGCAGKEYVEVVKTVEVKTPVACGIASPILAPYSSDIVRDEINIYVYAEDLENTLKACKGEK